VERKIYRDIHESYLGRKDLMTEGQVIDLYSKVDVLGIDELGRSSWTEHEAQILYEIIDNRDVYNRKTVMAGNLMPDEFRQKFDDSFRRKLGATTIVCTWPRWEER
jgi:DNA replication protein DnaC